ncbi:hypothetical protein ILFOPFJJ_05790 [Ensifer psoraleae]|nr:hypothetical protein [Sinorhizobium psoraleae]
MIMGLAQHHKPRTTQNVIALPVKIATPKVSHIFSVNHGRQESFESANRCIRIQKNLHPAMIIGSSP